MAVADAVRDELLGEGAELLDEALPELGAARCDCALGHWVVGGFVRVGGPAVDVAADPARVFELLEPFDGLAGERAEHGVVAAEEVAGRAFVRRVFERRLERGEVAVDVVEEGEGHVALRTGALTGPGADGVGGALPRMPP